jgi:hypothetical protein
MFDNDGTQQLGKPQIDALHEITFVNRAEHRPIYVV